MTRTPHSPRAIDALAYPDALERAEARLVAERRRAVDPSWQPADAEGFSAKTAMLVEQFNSYEAQPGKMVNGKLTLGENIADLGGLTVAYDALKLASGADFKDPMTDGMTQDQRFFINWATVWRRGFTDKEMSVRLVTDSHAPAGFRANGAPSNMPIFAAAFGCKAGDPMVRSDDQRIAIW